MCHKTNMAEDNCCWSNRMQSTCYCCYFAYRLSNNTYKRRAFNPVTQQPMFLSVRDKLTYCCWINWRFIYQPPSGFVFKWAWSVSSLEQANSLRRGTKSSKNWACDNFTNIKEVLQTSVFRSKQHLVNTVMTQSWKYWKIVDRIRRLKKTIFYINMY